MRKNILTLFIVFILIGGLFSGCKKENTASAKKIIHYYERNEPECLDAQKFTGSPEGIMTNMFLEGLTRYGKEEGEYIPGVAKSWSYNEEENSYTFILRENAKWDDGKAVVADDFFFAWRHAIDENAPYAFLFTDFIKGTKKYQSYTKEKFLTEKDGKKADENRVKAMTDEELNQFNQKKEELWSKVGLESEGNTLKVYLKVPAPFFVGLTAFWVYMPMNKDFYEEHSKTGDYGLEASGLYANGPWKITEWNHKDSLKYTRNENYWNKDNINIDEIHLKIVFDVETRTNLLKTGKLDGAAIQAKDLLDFEDLAVLDQYNLQELTDKPDFSCFYVEFNHFSNKYTSNVNIRKAMAYAMDRESFVEKINIGDAPAYGLIPETFPGLNKSFREENGMRLFDDNNNEKAKEYLAKGLKELGLDKLPPLEMLTGESDISKKIAEKFQADWADIGITVNLVPVPWGVRLKRQRAGDFALSSAGWGPDYPDPMTYLEVFETGNGNNHGKYSNKEYDNLLQAARNEKNAAKRMNYMYQAEKLLFDDMALVPQYYRTVHRAYKHYLTGAVERGLGPAIDFYWADIDMEAKAADRG